MVPNIFLWLSPTTEPITTNICDQNVLSTFFPSFLSNPQRISYQNDRIDRMISRNFHLKSSIIKQKTNKQKAYLGVSDRFGYKEAFLVNAPLFWSPGFCKYSRCSYF